VCRTTGTRRHRLLHKACSGPSTRSGWIASNNDGVWNQIRASLSFTLRPHLYQTCWFYAVCVLVMPCSFGNSIVCACGSGIPFSPLYSAERNRIAREIHDNLAQEMLGISVYSSNGHTSNGGSTEQAKTQLDRARILVRNRRCRSKTLRLGSAFTGS